MIGGFKAGLSGFMSAAKSVAAKVEEKLDELVGNAPAAPEKPRIGIIFFSVLVYATYGSCGDFKL